MQWNCIRKAVLLSSAMGVVACQGATTHVKQNLANSASGLNDHRLVPGQSDLVACPAQKFEDFLRMFGSTTRSDIRERYTLMPLEYEAVSEYVLNEVDENTPPMSVIKVTATNRSRYFSIRYIERLQDYDYVGINEQNLEAAINSEGGGKAYPLELRANALGDYEVVAGSESEVDTFIFKRMHDCWYLKRAINSRD